MIVIGLDPCSTKNLGFCVFNDTELVTCGTNVLVGINSFLEINDFMEELVEDYSPDLVIMERSIGLGFAPLREKICENTGAIKMLLSQKGIKFDVMNTKSAYKTVIGTCKKIDNKKKNTIAWIKKEYNLDVNEHAADSILMVRAHYATAND